MGRNQEDLYGSSPGISFVLHHLLKELPTEVIRSNFVGILHLIECSQDHYFDQVLPVLHACTHTHTIGIYILVVHARTSQFCVLVFLFQNLNVMFELVLFFGWLSA